MIHAVVCLAICLHTGLSVRPSAVESATIDLPDEQPSSTACPKASRHGQSKWVYMLNKSDAKPFELLNTFVLMCDKWKLGSVEVAPYLDPYDPLHKSYVQIAINNQLVRKALMVKAETCSNRSVRFLSENQKLGACLAVLDIPLPRFHFRKLFYNLPFGIGPWLRSEAETLDEEEPIGQDVLEVAMVVLLVMCFLLFLWTCKEVGFVASTYDELARVGVKPIVQPPCLIVPKYDEIARETFVDIWLYLFSVFAFMCPIFLVLRRLGTNGACALIVLLAPIVVASVGALRILKTGIRRQVYYGGLRQGVWIRSDVQGFDVAVVWVLGITTLQVIVVICAMLSAYLSGNIEFSEMFAAGFVFVVQAATSISYFTYGALDKQTTSEWQLDLRHFVSTHDPAAKITVDLSMPLQVLSEARFMQMGRDGVADPLKSDRHAESEGDISASTTMWKLSDIRWQSNLMCRWTSSDRSATSSTRKQLKLIPNLVLLLVVLQSQLSLMLGMGYMSFVPSLLRFGSGIGHVMPSFEPHVYEYGLVTDMKHSNFPYFADANPQEATAMIVEFPNATVQSNVGSVSAITDVNDTFPVSVNVSLLAGFSKITYSMRLRPILLMVKSVVLRGKIGAKGVSFQRCLRWGELPGTVISLPKQISHLSVELAATDYELSLPISQDEEHPADTPFSMFLPNITRKACRALCERHPRCIVIRADLEGCYQVYGEEGCIDSHMQRRFPHESADSELRQFLRSRTYTASLCFPEKTGRRGEHCQNMASPEEADDLRHLQVPDVQVDWLDETAAGMLRVNVVNAEQASMISRFDAALNLQRGTPAVPHVLSYVGEELAKVKITISDEPRITVELEEYNATAMGTRMLLYLVPLIMDPGFVLENAGKHNKFPPFQACHEDLGFLRFKACGGHLESRMMVLALDPWSPFQNVTMNISARPGLLGFDILEIPVLITTARQDEPLQWLVRHSCDLPDMPNLYTAKVVGEIAASPVCNSEKAAKIVAEHLSKWIGIGLSADVLLKLGTNPNFNKAYDRISKLGIPSLRDISSLEKLATLNASQPLMLKYCDLMNIKDFMYELVTIFHNGVAPMQMLGCIEKKGVEAILRKAVICSCENCVRAVKQTIKESKVLSTQFEKIHNFSMNDSVFAEIIDCHPELIGAHNKSMSAEALVEVVSMLRDKLRVFVLPPVYATELEPNTTGELWNMLTSLPQLEILQLPNLVAKNFLDAFLLALWKNAGLQKVPQLKSLDLSKNDFRGSNKSIDLLERSLGRLDTLETLILEQTDIDTSGAEHLVRAWPNLQRLKHISLDGDRLGTQGLEAIAYSLGNLTSLEDFALQIDKRSLENISEVGAEALASSFSKLTQLQMITLTKIGLNTSGLNLLAPALTKKRNLKRLGLQENNIGPEGGTLIADVLQSNPEMEWLSIGSNNLGGVGATNLIPGLKNLAHLVRFEFALNGIDTEACTALVGALVDLRQRYHILDNVDFIGNEVDRPDAISMQEELQKAGVTKAKGSFF